MFRQGLHYATGLGGRGRGKGVSSGRGGGGRMYRRCTVGYRKYGGRSEGMGVRRRMDSTFYIGMRGACGGDGGCTWVQHITGLVIKEGGWEVRGRR